MVDGDGIPGSRQQSSVWIWPVIISVIVALVQFVGYGTVIGRLLSTVDTQSRDIDNLRVTISTVAATTKQVEVNTDWIKARAAANLDSRTAVLETDHRNLTFRVDQIDRHLSVVDDRLEAHMRDDRIRFNELPDGTGKDSR